VNGVADPNLVDFYNRVERISTAHKNGHGHEAEGTLGRAFYKRAAKKNKSVVLPFVVGLFIVLCFKGALYHVTGKTNYDFRVEQLKAGEGFDRLGGTLMAAGPMTRFTADRIGDVVAYVNQTGAL
jgi:hypothetical protein